MTREGRRVWVRIGRVARKALHLSGLTPTARRVRRRASAPSSDAAKLNENESGRGDKRDDCPTDDKLAACPTPYTLTLALSQWERGASWQLALRSALGRDRVVQHAGAADFFGTQPELLADQLFAAGQDELDRVAAAAQVVDLPRFAPPARGEQDALEADRKIGEVGDLLLDDSARLRAGEWSGGAAHPPGQAAACDGR